MWPRLEAQMKESTEALEEMLDFLRANPNTRAVVAAPTRYMAVQIFREFLKRYDAECAKVRSGTSLSVCLENGALIHFLSLDRPRSFLGPQFGYAAKVLSRTSSKASET